MGPQPRCTTGRVVGNRLEMDTIVQERKTSAVMRWSPQYGGFTAPVQSLLRKPMQPGERRTLESLQPGFIQLATTEFLARDWEKVSLPDGVKELLPIDSVTILPDAQKTQAILWIDRSGETLKLHSKEMNIDIVRTTKADALNRNAGELLDINTATAVKLDRPIPNAHETKKIRYRLHLEGDDPAKAFPAGPTQQIKPIDANTAELTVFSIRAGQKEGNADAPADPPGAADRAPNSMLQSDDPLVVSLADEAAGQETDPWKTALRLEEFVHGYINMKDFSQVFASAAEVAKTREGDCTEHAVLLAALCRVKKIPARVAIGLVYTQRATTEGPSPEFAYHMWAEVFIDGRWIPLDATLGRGGIGAAHLKVAHSNLQGASMYSSFLPVVQVVGRLKVEVPDVE
jgi:transglutaminase-like putative cysteine protease